MKYKINLATKKKLNFVDNILYFFINYLRYIFVITQLVVIGVFFYRFKIDQSIVDLRESIDQKQEIIQVVYPLLNQADKVDKRIKEVRKVLDNQSKLELMLSYILSIFPEQVFLSNMSIEKDSLKLTGRAYDASQLKAFYNRLQKDNYFNFIELRNIRRTADSYSFTLNLNQIRSNK